MIKNGTKYYIIIIFMMLRLYNVVGNNDTLIIMILNKIQIFFSCLSMFMFISIDLMNTRTNITEYLLLLSSEVRVQIYIYYCYYLDCTNRSNTCYFFSFIFSFLFCSIIIHLLLQFCERCV